MTAFGFIEALDADVHSLHRHMVSFAICDELVALPVLKMSDKDLLHAVLSLQDKARAVFLPPCELNGETVASCLKTTSAEWGLSITPTGVSIVSQKGQRLR